MKLEWNDGCWPFFTPQPAHLPFSSPPPSRQASFNRLSRLCQRWKVTRKVVCCVDVKKKTNLFGDKWLQNYMTAPKMFRFLVSLFLLYAFCVRRFFPSMFPPVCPQASISNPSPPSMSVGMYLPFSFFFPHILPLHDNLATSTYSRTLCDFSFLKKNEIISPSVFGLYLSVSSGVNGMIWLLSRASCLTDF